MSSRKTHHSFHFPSFLENNIDQHLHPSNSNLCPHQGFLVFSIRQLTRTYLLFRHVRQQILTTEHRHLLRFTSIKGSLHGLNLVSFHSHLLALSRPMLIPASPLQKRTSYSRFVSSNLDPLSTMSPASKYCAVSTQVSLFSSSQFVSLSSCILLLQGVFV